MVPLWRRPGSQAAELCAAECSRPYGKADFSFSLDRVEKPLEIAAAGGKSEQVTQELSRSDLT